MVDHLKWNVYISSVLRRILGSVYMTLSSVDLFVDQDALHSMYI